MLMYKEVIDKIINMCEGEEFDFIICEKDNSEFEYSIKVKCIWEFDSLLVIMGNIGGGFNMIFETNYNIVDRENCLRDIITKEFEKEFSMCKFIGFYE
ncbi:hypothetical protein QB607_003192 [Clostridium botulinum]|nr:hypothetical protein [Clostridium botulinum]EKS4395865.1 hypothetical protein [Clostridium botulinum]